MRDRTIVYLFTDLWNKTKKHFHTITQFDTDDQYSEVENIFKRKFNLDSKLFFSKLTKYIIVGDFEKQLETRKNYFITFIYSSIFLCSNYNYKIVFDNDTFLVQELGSGNEVSKSIYYYIFYNRSQPHDNKIGVGLVVVNGVGTAKAEFYYSPKGERDQLLGYSTVKAEGKATFRKNSITTLSLSDIDEGGHRNEFGALTESYFIIKSFHQVSEKIVLGIKSSWHRDLHFPLSTVAVFVERNYYEQNHTKSNPKYFENIKKNRNDHLIPEEIFYYLAGEQISLEQSLDLHKNNKKKFEPFGNISELPYSKEDIKYVSQTQGMYQGLSIVNNGIINILILSQLEILHNGEVILTTGNYSELDKSFGLIRKIDILPNGNVRINIAFRISERHYSSLHYHLEFKNYETQLSAESTAKELQGSFAGISAITGMPTGSSVVFERKEMSSEINVKRIELVEGMDKKYWDDIKKFSIVYPNLFSFFVNGRCNLYSNNSGIKLLEGFLKTSSNFVFEKDYDYEVFISVPLLYNKDESIYYKNSSLAWELRNELSTRYSIQKSKIFCACFNEVTDLLYDFTTYCKERNEKEWIFQEIREKLSKSKRVFFIYPRQPSDKRSKISSSIFEVGYALGLDKDVIIFFDSQEEDFLPSSLMNLYGRNSFYFDSTDEQDQFKKIFDNKSKRIKERAKL